MKGNAVNELSVRWMEPAHQLHHAGTPPLSSITTPVCALYAGCFTVRRHGILLDAVAVVSARSHVLVMLATCYSDAFSHQLPFETRPSLRHLEFLCVQEASKYSQFSIKAARAKTPVA